MDSQSEHLAATGLQWLDSFLQSQAHLQFEQYWMVEQIRGDVDDLVKRSTDLQGVVLDLAANIERNAEARSA